MIIITEAGIPQTTLDALREHLEEHGVRTHVSHGTDRVVFGCIGDTSQLDAGSVRLWPGVASVVPVRTPYRLASRGFRAAPTLVPLGDAAGTVLGTAGTVTSTATGLWVLDKVGFALPAGTVSVKATGANGVVRATALRFK